MLEHTPSDRISTSNSWTMYAAMTSASKTARTSSTLGDISMQSSGPIDYFTCASTRSTTALRLLNVSHVHNGRYKYRPCRQCPRTEPIQSPPAPTVGPVETLPGPPVIRLFAPSHVERYVRIWHPHHAVGHPPSHQ